MKKIRILALILALLMLPLGMLVSCKKDKVDSGENGDDSGDTSQKRPTSSTTTVDDGTAPGYLCYYNFDNATQGSFVAAAPYGLFQTQTNGGGTVGFVIGRRDINGKKGGYLGIERGKEKVAPYFDMAVMTITGLTPMHVVSFDVYLGGGVVNDGFEFIGRKGSGIFNHFLDFKKNGDVYAASKHKIYTANPAGEWVNFAVAINDLARTFDVYIDGVKVIVGVEYPTAGYLDWDSQKIDKYRLVLNASGDIETEMRIDNFAISSGLTPQNSKGESNVIYTDVYSEVGELFTLGGVEESKQKVLDIYTANDALKKAVKSNPYEAGKVAMSSALSLAKIEFIGGVGLGTELQYDYSVELGNSKYGGNIGGKTFYSDPEIGKSYMFRSDIVKDGVDIGKLIVVDENGKEGVYILDGDENFTKITIIIDERTTYAIYADGVFKTVSDDTFNPEDEKAIEYHEGAFHGKDYSYLIGSSTDTENDFISIILSPDQINGVVDFSMMVNDTLDISATGVPFNFDSGMLTFTVGEGADKKVYCAAYNQLSDEFTLVDPNNQKQYLLKPPASEQITATDSDKLGLHYQNFRSGSSSLIIPVDNAVAQLKPWEKFALDLYIPDNMVNFKFGLYLHCGEGKYYYLTLSFNKSGEHTKGVPLNEFTAVGNPDIKELTSVEFRMTGSGEDKTAFGPSGDTNGSAANDGHDLYLYALSLVQEKIAEVEGPKSIVTCNSLACGAVTYITALKNPNKCPECNGTDIVFKEAIEYCTHKAQTGESYLVAIDEAIPCSCTSIGYYAMLCTNCFATVIDDTKPITDAIGHNVSGQSVLTYYPTCTEAGYTYQICKNCLGRVQKDELPIKAHEYYEVLNNASGKMDYTCKHCGHSYSNYLNATLLSGKEKYDLLPDGSFSFIAYEGFNDTVKLGDLAAGGASSKVGDSNLSVNPKYATLVSTRVNGQFCLECTKGDTSTKEGDVHNPYFDVDVGGKIGAGAAFVFEFDIMPGDKNKDGEYGGISATFADRTTSSVKWVSLFTVSRQAVLTMNNDPAKTPVKLATDKFTNIAISVDPAANLCTLYVNGVFVLRCPFGGASTYNVYQARIQFDNNKTANTDTSYYYNHLFVYPGVSPLCLVNTDIIAESKGEIGLYDSATPATDATPITELTTKVDEVLADKKIFLKNADKSSDFTFSFTITPAALTDGALLKAEKLDVFDERTEKTVLSVNGEYLYYMGVPIYKLTGAADEKIDITIRCEDYLGRASVSVNGTEIITKKAYGTGDGFSETDSYVRNYTFCKDAGEYSVSNIKFVTVVVEE